LKKAWLASITLLFTISVLVINSQAAYAADVDLNTWMQEGPGGNGNWAVAGDGSSVFQSINGAPTMFVSPDSVINSAIGGTIEVETTGDDDYIGFVMGFGNDDSDPFILFDWKQLCQSFEGFSFNGFVLARVTGGADSIPFGDHHLDQTDYDVLATNIGDNAGCPGPGVLGWADNTPYDIIIEYNSDRITIKVSGGAFGPTGQVVLDVFASDVGLGSFDAGRFGFFNHSQASVRYSGFVDDPEPITPTVGGEFLPIETTSLLLAGAQSFSWMIPVILSGIGIGLFVVSRKSE